MKMKTVSLLAGVAVPLILAGSASSALIGVKTVKKFVDPADIAADNNLGGAITGLLVVNVYAVFTPGDAAAAVIGVGGSTALGIDMNVSVRDGTFFQHPAGVAGHTTPSQFLSNLAGFNALKHDSFITIGRKLDDDAVFGADVTSTQDLNDWGDTRLFNGPPNFETVWFVADFPAQSIPGDGPDNPPDQVLIAQFTVANPVPNAGVFGQMFVNARQTSIGGKVEEISIVGIFDNQVPAPGALALLGTAGLLGCRRRRRRS